MGITPGETSYDEAVSIVEKYEFDSEEEYYEIKDDFNYIQFYGGDDNNALIYYYTGKVEFIRSRLIGVDLGSIIDHYGEPDGYSYHPGSHGYSISIYYPDLGLVFVAAQGLHPISEDMSVPTVYFLYPMDPDQFPSVYFEKLKIMNPRIVERPYLEWEGFGVYPSDISK
jgi:hypothetical protein